MIVHDLVSTLRSTSDQLKDEFAASYKRMTDPEEHEKAQMEKQRAGHLSDLQADAGL